MPGLSEAQGGFRRSLEQARKSRYSKEERGRIVESVRQRFIENPGLFRTLDQASYSRRVKIFDRNDFDVVVKDITEAKHGGSDYARYLEFHKIHDFARKTGIIKPSYRLVPLKVFGYFEAHGRKYVVMERIVHQDSLDLNPDLRKSLNDAKSQLRNHAFQLSKTYDIIPPQVDVHILTLGNTNPAKPARGRWILSLPMDFG